MAKFAFEFDQPQVQLLLAMPTIVGAAYASLGNSIQEQIRKGPIPEAQPHPQQGNGATQPEAPTTNG